MKYTTAEVLDVVEQEGLSNAILNYIKPTQLTDRTLSRLWDEAKELLEQIQTYIDENHTDISELEDEDDEDTF
jgi:hypothetical protein